MRSLGTALLAIATAATVAAEPVARERIGIVDGDTVTVDGESWRLLGYDTPESEHAWCEAERRMSAKATARLAELVAGAQRLEIEASGARDRYRRVLGRLLVDGRDVAEIMIAEAWARPSDGGKKRRWCARDDLDVPPPR
jgi:endonuclease YncB( thermonuclease family)